MDKCNCEFYWKEVSKFSSVCSKHNSTFDINSKCPFWIKENSIQSKGKLTVNHGKLPPVKSRRIYERFHSFRMKFNASIEFDSINGDLTNLRNNVKFKRLEYPTAIVQVFSKSILIILRKSQELIDMPVKLANTESKRLIYEIINKLPKEIKVTDSKLVECHNAFVNHPFAKRNVTVKVNDEVRFISDNSKGNPEFESVNPTHVIADSEAIEQDIVSLIDKGLSRDYLAHALNELIKDRYFHAENMRTHVEAIRSLSEGVKELKDQVKSISPKNNVREEYFANSFTPLFSNLNTISRADQERKDKIKRFIEKYR